LEQSSNFHVIAPITSVSNVTSFSPLDARDLQSGGTGLGSSTITEWDPNDRSPVDGAPGSPTAALLHELWHANLADEGGWTTEPVPGTGVARDEVDASMVENEQRRADGCPPRDAYCGPTGCADVPEPANRQVYHGGTGQPAGGNGDGC
jgi:hypothetical protein